MIAALLASVLILSSAVANPATGELSALLQLRSLPSSCKLTPVMIDRFGYSRLAVVLACGCPAGVVAGPVSLQGVVHIGSPEQALEYVRLFSKEQTYTLFDFGGLVEIAGLGKERLTPDGRYLVSDDFKATLESIHHEAVAIADTGSSSHRGKLFRIRRIVVATDGKVYDIEELVSDTGSYSILNRTVLLQKATDIGILHLGEI